MPACTKVNLISRETECGYVAFRIPSEDSEDTADMEELVEEWLPRIPDLGPYGDGWSGDAGGITVHTCKGTSVLGLPGDYIMFMIIPNCVEGTRYLAQIVFAKDVGPMSGRKKYKCADL